MQRFSRTELLIGSDGLAKLTRKKVAIFGIGGVGSFTAEALARSGIGALAMIDHDDVCITNLNRQIHALESTVGHPKVEVMAERLRQINPAIRLSLHREFYSTANGEKLVTPDLDFVVDAIDTVTSKVDLILRCVAMGIPIISSMGTGNKLDPLCFQLADISKTHTDPLAKAVRRLLRERGVTAGVQVLFSTEIPLKIQRRPPGSIAFVPSVAGLVIAGAVIRNLLAGGDDISK
ncbi:MAG: tRNA threonylcarbamoyladenosine dehydratase [Firmicutes bacterium]|nr:tRNA threonylcarbamoyladenosine dehydratase [Bacillota bacterium]